MFMLPCFHELFDPVLDRSDDSPKVSRTSAPFLLPGPGPAPPPALIPAASQGAPPRFSESVRLLAQAFEEQCSDEPPGFVSRRYTPHPGTFCAARILLGPSSGFYLWRKSGPDAVADADKQTYRYAWRAFLDVLEASDKSVGTWRQLAFYMHYKFQNITDVVKVDVVNAFIELALRDAEYSRLAFRYHPFSGIRPGEEDISDHDRDELTMTRVRSACGYVPRKSKLVDLLNEAISSFENDVREKGIERVLKAIDMSHLP